MTGPDGLFDVAALRALEARGIARAGGDGFALMARAGQAAWRCLLEHWPDAVPLCVVCGPGNNGGDGYVLATHAQRSGRATRLLALAPPRTPEARQAAAAFREAGGVVLPADAGLGDAGIVVDALFGIGLERAPDGEAARLVQAINGCGAPVLALDVPSGVDADSGAVPGSAVRATRTLEFIACKRGLRTGAAVDHVGALQLARIGLDAGDFEGIKAGTSLLSCADLRLPRRARNAHKGLHGHVLCIGGEAGSGGAILLAAEAALRSGAGLVSVATRAAHVPALLARCPEAMAHAPEDADAAAALAARCDVIALGPGLGQGLWSRALVDAAFASGKPCVVDADALNLIARDGIALPRDCVLTPHPGEAARLLGRDVAAIQHDRFAAAAELAGRFGAVVVLKGAGSIIATVDAIPSVIGAGNPGMAVGGMGDVLTGVIAALCAQGLCGADAARMGALLHACAGDGAAAGGERGLLARDVIDALRGVAMDSAA